MLRLLSGLFLFLLSLSTPCLAGDSLPVWQEQSTLTSAKQTSVAVSFDGKLVAAGEFVQMAGKREVGRSGGVTLFDLATKQSRELSLPAPTDGQRVAHEVAFTPDGHHLIVAVLHLPLFPKPLRAEIVIFDCDSGEAVSQFRLDDEKSPAAVIPPRLAILRNWQKGKGGSQVSTSGSLDPSRAVVAEPLLMATAGQGCLRWFDEDGNTLKEEKLQNLKSRIKFPKRAPKITGMNMYGLAVSEDIKIAAVSVAAYGLLTYRDGEPAKFFKVASLPVFACDVNRSGSLVAVCCKDGSIRYYNPDGALKGTLSGKHGGKTLSFSPYGDKLIGLGDRSTYIWDLATKTSVEVQAGGWDASWGPDGETIYTVGEDGLKVINLIGDSPKTATVEKPSIMEE